jgi:hypothetical protein
LLHLLSQVREGAAAAGMVASAFARGSWHGRGDGGISEEDESEGEGGNEGSAEVRDERRVVVVVCVCLLFVTPRETNIIDLWVSPFESRGLEKPCMLLPLSSG